MEDRSTYKTKGRPFLGIEGINFRLKSKWQLAICLSFIFVSIWVVNITSNSKSIELNMDGNPKELAAEMKPLGINIKAATNLGFTKIRTHKKIVFINGRRSIKKVVDIQPEFDNNLKATLDFYYKDDELEGINEKDLILYSSTDGGTTWSAHPNSKVDTESNSIHLNGIGHFSLWTAASKYNQDSHVNEKTLLNAAPPCPAGTCPPIAGDDTISMIQGTVAYIPILNNDIDPDDNLDTASLTIVSQLGYGTVIINPNGEVGYISSTAYIGLDILTYSICDNTTPAALCDTATIFITIEANPLDACGQASLSHIFYLPYPVEYLYSALRNASGCPDNLGNTIRSVTTIKTPYPGLVLTYDHWEDDYETSIVSPAQLTTLVWGDGDFTNGIAPGYPTDIIPEGGNIVLDNSMIYNPRNPNDFYFDAKDKIFASSDVAVSIIAGDDQVFAVQAAKTDVYDVAKFGSQFTVPIGEDLGGEFQYTSLFIRAAEDSTNLQIDKDYNGTFETLDTINEGEVLFIDGLVLSGATLISSNPVGVDVLFGGIDCFGTRQINLLPAQFYGNTYYSPVPTTLSSAPAAVFVYNSLSDSITINWSNNTNTGSFVVPGKSTIKHTLALINSAYKFESDGGEHFIIMEVIDSDASGQAYDWSFNLTSEERLSDFASIAWAPGSVDLSGNYNPIWITPTATTTMYVKFDGNLVDNQALQSPCNIAYDTIIPLNYLDSYKLYDNSDNDQSGIAFYTCDGTKLAGVWGEDPNAGNPTPTGSPAMDVGTSIQPLCRDLAIIATDDQVVSPVDGTVIIPVYTNDHGFVITLDLSSISTNGLTQPSNGNIISISNGNITYEPYIGYEGPDEFEYIICSNEFPSICDIAMVRVEVTNCDASAHENLVQGFVYLEQRPDNGAYDDEPFLPQIQVNLFGDTDCNGVLDVGEIKIDSLLTDVSGSFAYQFTTVNGEYVQDDFENGVGVSSGNSGSVLWTNNWTEIGETNGFSISPITIGFDGIDGDNALIINGSNNGVSRNALFSEAEGATLNFEYRRQNLADNGEGLNVQISNSNGTFTLMSIDDGNGVGTDNFYIPVSLTIPLSNIDPDGNNTIQFITNGSVSNSDFYFIDKVKFIYHTPEVCFIAQVDTTGLNGAYFPAILKNQSTSFLQTIGLGNCSSNLYLGVLANYIAVNDTLITELNTSIAIDVLANDIGLSDTTTLSTTGLLQPVEGALIVNTDATISYQPNFNFLGIDSFEYRICSIEDSVICDTARVYVTVTCPMAPGGNFILGTVFYDSSGDGFLQSGESGQPGAKVRLYEDLNQDGLVDAGDIAIDSITTIGDGEFSFSPIIGSFPFYYIIQIDRSTVSGVFFTTNYFESASFLDTGQSDCLNHFGVQNCISSCLPEVNDDIASTDMGAAVAIDVLANDYDSDGDLDPTTVNSPAGGVQPTNGTISINPVNGVITYAPYPLFNGVDFFEYQVCDQSLPVPNCGTAMVTVTVSCPTVNGQNLINGYVFDDLDGNGIYEFGESGGANVKVRLYNDVNQDGVLDAGDMVIDSMLSNVDGTYSFSSMLLSAPQTITIDIVSGTDDAEERKPNGNVSTTSSDLEMGNDAGNNQWIGLRFNSVQIPPGAFIQNAYLEFYADGNNSTTTNLTIYGEDVDDAATFSNANSNISNRPRTDPTAWSNIPAWIDNNTYASPDISSIVQEIVDRTNWTSGNDMAIIIDGIGRRRAESFDGTGGPAPQLVIEYATAVLPAYFIMDVDVSTLPIGTILTTDNIELSVFPTIGEDDCVNNFGYQACPGSCQPIANDDAVSTDMGAAVVIQVLSNDYDPDGDLDSTTVSIPPGGLQPSNGTTYINPINGEITYTPFPVFNGVDTFEYQVCDQASPIANCDIAMVIVTVSCPTIGGQNLISGYVFDDLDGNGIYESGENGGANVKVRVYNDVNQDGVLDANDIALDSMLSNGDGTYSFSPIVLSAPQTITIDIISNTDDAEERKTNGVVTTNSSDLELGNDQGFNQWIGLRFNSVAIPSGAFIQNAHLEFYADGNHSTNTNLTIYGEDVDNAATFSTANSSISGRSKTAPISWDNVPNWTDNNTYSSPEISSIVQSIVDRANWSIGNDMAFIIDGTGRRRAESFSGNGPPPRLVVEYVTAVLPAYFIMNVDESTLPVGTILTTDNLELTVFPSIGEDDCINNFGYQFCPGGCPPEANDDFAVTEEGASVVIDVLANDTDGDNDLDESSVSIPVAGIQPSNGSTSINPINGNITYTPDLLFIGIDSFEYQVCDQSSPIVKCDTAMVRVTVNCVAVSGQNIISGYVFDDANGNGVLDNGENGGANVKVRLYEDINEDGLLDAGDVAIDSMLSLVDGTYTFSPTVLGPTQSLTIDVVAGEDDAEENKTNGSVNINGNDLEMGNDGGNDQWVGLRFKGLTIPSGAIIQTAYIEFYAKGNPSVATNLTIYGENVDSALAFSTADNDISSRIKTDTLVNWLGIPGWTDNQTYSTPMISSIVQSIVDRPNWASGNDMVFMIEGTGRRRAESFEGNGLEPRLVIEYVVGFPAHYVMAIDESTIPIGTLMTSDNVESSIFTAISQIDCINNFGYQACPGGCSPIAVDDTDSTEVDIPVFIDVPANDFDPENNLDLTSVNIPVGLIQPANGTTNIDLLTGVISYTPDIGFIGLDSFEYVICDLSLPVPKCDTALVKVNVKECNTNADQVKMLGQLFLDKNDNSINDDDGTGLQGVTVYLFSDFDCNGNINGADAVINTTTTDTTGRYDFVETVGFTGFPYCYVTQVDATAIPVGYVLTTSANNTTSFSAPATCDKTMDVGAKVFVTAVDDLTSMLTYTGFTDIDVVSNDLGNLSTPTLVTQPTAGTATVNGNGTIRFQPDDDSVTGSYVFTYQICSLDDPAVCDIGQVTVVVLDCVAGPTEKIVRGKVYHDINESASDDAEAGIANIDVKIYEDVNENSLVDGADVLLSTENTDLSGDYSYTFIPSFIQANDQFPTATYSGGSGPWSTDWIETDPFGTAGPTGNYVGITGGELFFHWAYQNDETIQRSVDLTGTTSATLSFDWRTVGLDAGKSLTLQVSLDGSVFTNLIDFTGTQTGSFSQDISTYISNNTTIRFLNENSNWDNGEYTYLDNFDITAQSDITHFVIETDPLTYPAGHYLTTDNIETAIILSTGQCDSPNNFGLNFRDNDVDGITDLLDLDDDNDGIPDLTESPSDPLVDADNDGVPFYLDDDDGNVGVGDDDGFVESLFDFDGDNIPNHFDLDSDNDSCPDAAEAGHNQTLEVDNTIAGPFGLNGLAVTVESDDTPLASITYALSESTPGIYDFLNGNINLSCNQAPLAISDINATEIELPVSGNLLTNDQDPDGDSLIINQLSFNVFGGTVLIDSVGNYVFTPIIGFSGEAGFSYSICDDGNPALCDTAQVNIDVIDISNSTNNQISGMEDNFVTENDNILSSNLLSNDSDPEGDSLLINTIPISTPSHGTLSINTDGTFEYTPNTNFAGRDQFAYEVCDDATIPACDTVLVRIEILTGIGLNDLYATDDANLGNMGDTLSGSVIMNDNDPSNGALTVNTIPLYAPTNGTINLSADGTYSYIPDPGFFGNDRFVYQVCDNGSPVACDSATVYLTIFDNSVLLNFKVMLHGALFGASDSLMRADLVAQNLVPLQQPYSAAFDPLFASRFVHTIGGSEITTNAVLNANSGTPDGIVDWVFIELRDPTDSVTVIRTISALVQRDGDIVDATTGGNLYVTSLFGEFFVIVKHRNHLGAMTAAPISIINKIATADFTTMTGVNLYHTGAYDGLEQVPLFGINALWAGNANADLKVKYDGSLNDRIILANNILQDPGNTGLVLNYNNAKGYYQGDINMDGKAKYDGFLNDRIILQYIIFTYPSNGAYLNNYNLMIEQIR